MATAQEQIIRLMRVNPVLAHRTCFAKRHPQASPAFHERMIQALHSAEPNVMLMAFRGAAKSTLLEECICLKACYGEFHNGVLLGESETRAIERLRSIKSEFEFNETLFQIFGVGPGSVWSEAKALLSNGVMLQAYGRNQSLRGTKHLQWRPDFLGVDDLEDEDSVRTPEARRKTMDYWTSVVVPALEPGTLVRMAATPLDPEALAPTLAKSKAWKTLTIPIVSVAETGEDVPAWPDRYPLTVVEQQREYFASLGRSDRFAQEYLCQAVDAASRIFTADMFRVDPGLRPSWHAVYVVFDPARTVKARSADTGMVVASWVGNRLVVWEAAAGRWLPDEIVSKAFELNRKYQPVVVAIEENGLNEFLLQPLRQASLLRRETLPLRPLSAPRGKIDFIRGLQPFFRAGEVIFAGEMQDLRDQLLGFPTGHIDVPNALAYMLKLRPGAPFYEFSGEHIADAVTLSRAASVYLAVNARGALTTAQLVQIHDGVLTVHADWLIEAAPGDCIADIMDEATLRVGSRDFKVLAPPHHWYDHAMSGLRPAVHRVPAHLQKGGRPQDGREEIRRKIRQLGRFGVPSFLVSREATWTARAMAGGYARVILPTGQVGNEPEETAYWVLMTAVESFAGLLRVHREEDDDQTNWAYTEDGRRYRSARA